MKFLILLLFLVTGIGPEYIQQGKTGKTVQYINQGPEWLKVPGSGKFSCEEITGNLSFEAEPPVDNVNLLTNSNLSLVNGDVDGWQLDRSNHSRASLYINDKEGDGLVIMNMYYDGFYQRVKLSQGHYILRALVKTNIYQIHAYVNVNNNDASYRYRIPAGISEDYRWVELPFYVTHTDNQRIVEVEVGIRYFGHTGGTGAAGRHTAIVHAKKIELLRLGNTDLPHKWENSFPAHLLHGLEAINEGPDWEQPGKVIFKDTFLGTELWLMTQGGQTDMSYAGLPDFSSDGKYLQTGHRRPGYVMKTDGSYRYKPTTEEESERWTWQILWPFPWEERRIPTGTNRSHWIVTSRNISSIEMLNLVTGETWQIMIPSRQGWQIIHFPSISNHAGRGPNISTIDYETIVWQSKDLNKLGISDMEGENFRIIEIKSISARPESDMVYPSVSKEDIMSLGYSSSTLPILSVGGKGGENWRNAVDQDGNRYFVFEINRDNPSDDPFNPYQVWALSLTQGDTYIAVARYPQPPDNVRLESKSLVWERPHYSKEIKGFNIYHSSESGKGQYKRINEKPIKETLFSLPTQKMSKEGFSVVTSVEHSGLESRNFSNEVSVGDNHIFRHFYQAEEGEIIKPMVPFFESEGASSSYAVAITDPELIYDKQLREGIKGSVKVDVDIASGGTWRIMARVRGMSGIERSTYSTGWGTVGEVGKGSFNVIIEGKITGQIEVDGFTRISILQSQPL